MCVPTSLLAMALALPLPPQREPEPPQAPRIEWQRTLADALAVQKETGLPLLIAVNVDGEVFNERFATSIYLDPEFVELTRGYVCVVASPDRHTERDYDAFGRRVECPRFSGCTCAEHAQLEPEAYARWFGGKRNAPRHVAVDARGKVLFDRYLDASMETAIDAIREHRGRPPATALPADPVLLFQRRDARARRELEARYEAADAAGRVALLGAAARATNEPIDLLRRALREHDERVAAAAARALAAVATAAHTIDLEDALARGHADTERVLVARLEELGRTHPPAARLARHFERAAGPLAMDLPWRHRWRAPAFVADDRAAIEQALDRAESSLRASPDDGEARLALATAQLALAELLLREQGRNAGLWLTDAQDNARRVRGDALQPEAQAVAAIVAFQLGDRAAANTAAAAARTAVRSEREPDGWLAQRFLAVVLQLAWQDAAEEGSAERDLRPQLRTVRPALDLAAARGALAEAAAVAGIAVLELAGCRHEARQRLAAAVRALPASAAVHERFRARLLVDLGAEGMRAEYARFVQDAEKAPAAQWFAGYAALAAAEQHATDARADAALPAYSEAIERLGASAAGNADYADSANHFAVLALAGRAELHLAAGAMEPAVADLLRAAELRPASLDETDGLRRKPRAIAGRVAQELARLGNTELAAKLAPIVQ